MKTAEIQTKNQFHEGYLISADLAVPSPRLKRKEFFIRIPPSNLQTPVKLSIFQNATITLQ